eukprot:7602531-Pyramimonas_sp.AAC.1
MITPHLPCARSLCGSPPQGRRTNGARPTAAGSRGCRYSHPTGSPFSPFHGPLREYPLYRVGRPNCHPLARSSSSWAFIRALTTTS